MVCVARIELATPTVSRWCSPTELHARVRDNPGSIADPFEAVKGYFVNRFDTFMAACYCCRKFLPTPHNERRHDE